MSAKEIDINENTVKTFVASLRPEDASIRKQLDYGYSYEGNLVMLYSIRPFWNNPDALDHFEFAKIKFIKTRKEWHLYWLRANGKWKSYEPFPKSTHLIELLSVIKEDAYGCFFG